MVKRYEEEEDVEEETKAEENLNQVTSKNKKDKENHSTNPRFDVITVKNSVILQMNVRMRKNQEFVKSRQIEQQKNLICLWHTMSISYCKVLKK